MRILAAAILLGIPVLIGTLSAGAPDHPACPEVKDWWGAMSLTWGAAVVALATMAIVRPRNTEAG